MIEYSIFSVRHNSEPLSLFRRGHYYTLKGTNLKNCSFSGLLETAATTLLSMYQIDWIAVGVQKSDFGASGETFHEKPTDGQ